MTDLNDEIMPDPFPVAAPDDGQRQQIPADAPGLNARLAMTDRHIINALMARLGNDVTLTLEEIGQAQSPSTLQFDGLTIRLIDVVKA